MAAGSGLTARCAQISVYYHYLCANFIVAFKFASEFST